MLLQGLKVIRPNEENVDYCTSPEQTFVFLHPDMMTIPTTSANSGLISNSLNLVNTQVFSFLLFCFGFFFIKVQTATFH